LGVSYEPRPSHALGLTFRGELRGDFDVVIQVSDLGSLVLPDLHIAGLAQFDPLQVQVEYAKTWDSLGIAAGATYKHWSALDGWLEPTVRCGDDHPDCGALETPRVTMKDRVVPRFGARYDVSLSARARARFSAGYFFEPTPLAKQRGKTNYFDNHRHALTLGYAVELLRPLVPLELSIGYQLHLLQPATHVKSASVSPDNPGYPEVETSGSVQSFSLALGVEF
jgi:long-chain fatty acid transport protein